MLNRGRAEVWSLFKREGNWFIISLKYEREASSPDDALVTLFLVVCSLISSECARTFGIVHQHHNEKLQMYY